MVTAFSLSQLMADVQEIVFSANLRAGQLQHQRQQ